MGALRLFVHGVVPGQRDVMVDALRALMEDPYTYAEMACNARGRIINFFQLEDAMRAYNRLYKELGIAGLNTEGDDIESSAVRPARRRDRDYAGAHRHRRRKEAK